MEKHLAWNENDSDEKKDRNNDDPWGKRRRSSNDDGLPDLDALLQKVQKWLKGSKGGGFGNGSSSDFQFDKKQGGAFLGLAGLIFAVIIGVMGFYKVEPGEQAVEYRFGKYISVQGPGPHWIFPGVYSKEIFNTDIVNQMNFKDDLITKEVNIVSVGLAVQYKIGDLENYLFKVTSPEKSLDEATKAAIRQVIAESTLEDVLSTQGKSKESYMGAQIQSLISENLALYKAGLDIQGVEILSVTPPEQVKEAFNDAIQAQEDEIRYKNEADAYKEKVVPVAQGKAARIIQDAKAYAAQTVFAAQGGVARFNAILPEYKRAPQVTRNRMYISTVESALQNTPKIMVDSKSNNVLFLPLDKFNFGKVPGISQDKANAEYEKMVSDNEIKNIEGANSEVQSNSNLSQPSSRTVGRSPRLIN